MLPRQQLGRTDLNVTQLGYGSMGIRGPATWGVRVVSEADAERVLNAVLDHGINFIDTAPDYGISEERIGHLIGHRRAEFILATKCGCDPERHPGHLELRHTWTKETIQRNIEQSLKRLRTEVIDLLQFHGGDAETLQRAGLIDLLREYQGQGVIRWMGISSSLPELPAPLRLGVFDTVQLPYSCLAPEHGPLMAVAAEQGVGVIVRGGIAQGGPDAEIQREALNQVWVQARLDELLPEGMPRAELILRQTLSLSTCHTTIVGTCNLNHLAENVAAAGRGPLPLELQQEITRRVDEVIAGRSS